MAEVENTQSERDWFRFDPSANGRSLRKAAIRLREFTVVAPTPTSAFRQASDDNSREGARFGPEMGTSAGGRCRAP